MRKLSILAALVFASVAAAGTLSAQVDTHKGFYGSVGIGYGGQTTSLTAPDGDNLGSLSSQETTWYGQVGLGVKPQWAFGVEFNYMKAGCGECGGNVHFTNSFYTAAATWYTSPKDNFFLKLNLGYAQNEVAFTGSSSDTEGGFAAGLGFGYDWAIGNGGFIVKPFANYMAQVSSATYSGGGSVAGDKGRAQLLQFGVGVGYKH
jgi:hypothetical protein